MKKDNEAGKALAPQEVSLPRIHVQIDEDSWERLDKELQDDLIRKRRNLGPRASRSAIGLAAVAIAAMSPLIVATGPIALIPLLPLLGMTAAAANDQKKYANLLPGSREEQLKKLRRVFRDAQIAAYAEQRKLLVSAAEQHIAQGNLISLEDAAWLANLHRRDVADATHQLAITVLQIRKLLAHSRCVEFRQDGSRKIGKPDTFAAHKLMPDHESHRQFLRLALKEADREIAEDTPPAFAEPELEEEQEVRKKTGFLGGCKVLLDPLSGGRLKRELEAAKILRVKPMEIPSLQPAADFAQALENYERNNAPLDLPAIRGWGGGRRKALPGPKHF
jgi:hypothetical protein